MLRTALPEIITDTLPGPKAQALIDRRAQAVPAAIRCVYPVAIALVATIASPSVSGVVYILIAMVIGGAIGARLALKVEMTQMPELVAILHSFVGLAAVLVGFNSFIELLPADAVQQLVLPLHGSPEEIMAAAIKCKHCGSDLQ